MPEDLVSAARREEIDWVHSEGVYEIVPMQECKDAGMKPYMIWVDTDKSVDPTHKKIRSKVLVSIMVSVSLSNEGKQMNLRHHDISRAPFQGTAQRLIYIRLPAEDRQKYVEDKVGRLVKSLWRVGRLPKRQTKCSIVSQSKSRCESGIAWRRLCVFVRLRWTKPHRQSSKIQIHSERYGNTWIRRFRREKPSVVEPCVWSWD